jgi:hypothetical protein
MDPLDKIEWRTETGSLGGGGFDQMVVKYTKIVLDRAGRA